jgi:hypothetical protein
MAGTTTSHALTDFKLIYAVNDGINDGKVDECSSVEHIFFDDVTQIVPTEHTHLETLTLKIEINCVTDTY